MCSPGLKCTKKRNRDSGYKKCYKMYSFATGEIVDDEQLCEGGHVYNKKCAEIRNMKQSGEKEALETPFKCDLTKSYTCQAQYYNGDKNYWSYYKDCQCSTTSVSDAYC